MLKNIFSVFVVCLLSVCCVASGVETRQRCADKDEPVYYGYNTDENALIRADYVIYFDNGKSDIPTACTSDVNGIIQELKSKATDIETVLLFGSATALGGASVNAPLAQRRVNTVNQLLKTANIPVCDLDGEGKASSRCAHISMGDSFYRSANPSDNTDSGWYQRAVFMFVIYKGDICDASTLSVLNTLISKVGDTSIKTQLESAKTICGNEGNLLLRSQRQLIMDAIKSTIEKYPDLSSIIPGNLSISILVTSIINARDALAVDASVWKNKDGKFNVARLASDSIAGVVLGTAGGLITSTVVKKNQIKKGFEDIMCTIGGQSVADYGDEFRVGIR